MILTRRKLIGGLATLIAAPAIIRVADIMRISPLPAVEFVRINRDGIGYDFTTNPPTFWGPPGIEISVLKNGVSVPVSASVISEKGLYLCSDETLVARWG